MARGLQIEWQEDERTLYELYKREKDPQNRTRLHTLWLLRTGRSMTEVTPLVGVHYWSLQEWIAWYRQGGTKAYIGPMKCGLVSSAACGGCGLPGG